MERLIVRNFGAIHDIAIDLKDLTIFIGENGTGKSTLAKLISIFNSDKFWINNANFSRYLAYYQISDLLENSTFIEYQSEMGVFIYNDGERQVRFSEDILRVLGKRVKITNQEEQEEQEAQVGRLLKKIN
ncbi:MAG: AAA family ATPase [Thioploca sp.]|nr:AAA family ATPase [Thioploca sp.]